MKKFLLILLSLVYFQMGAFSLVITHPESNHIVVDEDAIFFTGKIERTENVFINDTPIKPAKSRAFSYYAKLKEGENIFAITSKDFWGNIETIKYSIIKDTSKKVKYINTFNGCVKEYYLTIKDNVVLRSTPVDAGMNRLGYLPKNTKIVIDGTQNQFSRVYLTKDLFGWVKTSDVKLVQRELIPATEDVEEHFTEFEYIPNSIIASGKDKNIEGLYTVKLSDNTPYSLVEDNNKLTLSVYNLNKSSEMSSKDFPLGKFSRYSLSMNDGVINLLIKNSPINKSNYTNKNVKIVIDAGHGGSEMGAVGCLGHKEKCLNLEVAHKLKRILEFHNFDVYMTREKDEFVSLQKRVDYAKSVDALIFISIHLNSVPISSNPDLNTGTIVFYYNPVSKNLASELANEISKELNTQNSGASQASYAVIRPSEYIGVLVELAYLVNPRDVAVYKSKFFALKSAQAIYKGLINYIHKTL